MAQPTRRPDGLGAVRGPRLTAYCPYMLLSWLSSGLVG
jgi:hypothetical protein